MDVADGEMDRAARIAEAQVPALRIVVVGATYVLGGGAKVYAEVFWMDADSAVSTNTNNEGYGFILGTAVKF